MSENEEVKPKKSLAIILAELNELTNLLEEQEGVFEEGQDELLAISYEELETKLKAYRYRIKENEAKRTLLKDEVKRIQSRGKSLDNVNERLKDKMLQALLLFGEDGKSGNKTLKYDDVTFFTKDTEGVQGEFEAYNDLIILVLQKIKSEPEVFNNIDTIAEFMTTVYVDDERKLTLEEAKELFYFATIHITLKLNLMDLIELIDNGGRTIWFNMLSQPEYVGLTVINNKDSVKEYLKDNTHKIPNITIGINTSIQSR